MTTPGIAEKKEPPGDDEQKMDILKNASARPPQVSPCYVSALRFRIKRLRREINNGHVQ